MVIEVKNWLQRKECAKIRKSRIGEVPQIIDEIVKKTIEAGEFQFQLTH